MWNGWISSPPSSLGNPPHRVVTLGEIRNSIRIRYPGLIACAEGGRIHVLRLQEMCDLIYFLLFFFFFAGGAMNCNGKVGRQIS
jgi:hypothetical protein